VAYLNVAQAPNTLPLDVQRKIVALAVLRCDFTKWKAAPKYQDRLKRTIVENQFAQAKAAYEREREALAVMLTDMVKAVRA